MPSQVNKINYSSEYTIDKIVYENKDSPLTYSVADSTTPTQTVTNPLGAKCFVTLAWSVDGSNYYPAQAIVSPSNPYTANGWADATTVYIYMENFSGSTQTFYIKYALDTIS